MVLQLHVKSNYKRNVENMGAQILKEIASKTNDAIGDKHPTATMLAQSIVNENLKAVVAAGMNLIDLKRDIDKAVIAAVKEN